MGRETSRLYLFPNKKVQCFSIKAQISSFHLKYPWRPVPSRDKLYIASMTTWNRKRWIQVSLFPFHLLNCPPQLPHTHTNLCSLINILFLQHLIGNFCNPSSSCFHAARSRLSIVRCTFSQRFLHPKGITSCLVMQVYAEYKLLQWLYKWIIPQLGSECSVEVGKKIYKKKSHK